MWRSSGHMKTRGKSRRPRTPAVGDLGKLPSARVEQARCVLAAVFGCLALLVGPVEAADQSADSGNKHRIDTHNRLQLRAEQQDYRQSVEPRSPVEQRNLETQLHHQRLQQRNLQGRQDQRLQAERHKRGINQVLDPYRVNQSGPSLQRQQQQQRLQMRMQRNTWPYQRNYFRNE